MDEKTYARWWQLHLSVARGEALDAREQVLYQAGLAELDTEEKASWEDENLSTLRKLKAEMEQLERGHAQLQSKSRTLDRQIWMLEGAYMGLTGLELSSQGHAASPI